VDIDADGLYSAIQQMHIDFPYPGGADGASPFKKVATFVCYFMASRPVNTTIPEEILGNMSLNNPVTFTNAMVVLVIAIECLKGATVTWSNGEQKRLENRIELSKHSFIDIADAITTVTPSASFKLVSVLFEQMAYKNNPDCQYETS